MRHLERIKQIGRFVRHARSPAQWPAFATIGYARGHPFGGRDLAARVGRTLWPSIVVARPAGWRGSSIELDPADLGHLVSFEEIVVDGAYDLGLVPFTPDLILDCGAHIGLFAVLATARFPGVSCEAFEPDARNASFVRRQFARNRMKIAAREGASC
ncbi:MAG: hypothetical protein ACREIT_02945 [Tepidisphaeraceae bacterium]